MRKRILVLLFCASMLLCIPQAGATASLRGDADCDGSVTAADASLVMRYAVRLATLSSEGMQNADANLDDSVDASDAAVILRHLVKLVDIAQLTPMPSMTATPKPTATPAPTPTATPSIDPAFLEQIRIGCSMGSRDWSEYAEDIARFILSLPESNPYRAILIKGTEFMGMDYVSGKMDCSGFVREVYRGCGYSKYPTGSSNTVITYFKGKNRLHQVTTNGGSIITNGWEPGYILAYLDSQGEGNHVSIYLGKIDGIDFVMESARGAGGVCIRQLWSTDVWRLTYYIDPLPWPA